MELLNGEFVKHLMWPENDKIDRERTGSYVRVGCGGQLLRPTASSVGGKRSNQFCDTN